MTTQRGLEEAVLHAALNWLSAGQARRAQLGTNLADVDAYLLAAVEDYENCRDRCQECIDAMDEIGLTPAACPNKECRTAKEYPEPEPEVTWVPRRWIDVNEGDRVRIPGSDSSALVKGAIRLDWKASGTSIMRIRLDTREQPYDMPLTGPVEIERVSDVERAKAALQADGLIQ